ncbi:hypothetical protein AP1_0434 [Aeromonas phage AP1]|nr:hypothetical protein AP1_0434 [Aeromonas phage AP1]
MSNANRVNVIDFVGNKLITETEHHAVQKGLQGEEPINLSTIFSVDGVGVDEPDGTLHLVTCNELIRDGGSETVLNVNGDRGSTRVYLALTYRGVPTNVTIGSRVVAILSHLTANRVLLLDELLN